MLFSALPSKNFPQVFRIHNLTRDFPFLSCIFLHPFTNLTCLFRIFLVISREIPSSFLGISTQLSGNFVLLSRKSCHCFLRISFTLLGIYICFRGIYSRFQEITNAFLEIPKCFLVIVLQDFFPGISCCYEFLTTV